jgi:tetratricopeptide (TPR) repeat protein
MHVSSCRTALRLLASAGLAATFVLPALTSAGARTHENLILPTPFEVGDSHAGNYLAALIARADRDTFAAATFFREALRYDPRNLDLMEHAFIAATANGNMPDAFAQAERLIAQAPNSPNKLAHLVLGVKAIKARQFAAARAQFAKGGSPDQDLTSALLTAWTYAGAGDTKRALATADKLRDENFAFFRDYHKALIADVANDVPQATKFIKSAYEADKNTLRIVDAYARIMSRHGDRDEAIRAYEAFEQVLPNHPIVTSALADLKAGKTLEPFVRTPEQGAAEVLYGLGAASSRQDELDAMIYLRLALYLVPKNSLAVVTLGNIYESIKQNERAIDVYETVPEKDPLRTTADIQTGQILDALHRSDEAIKYLKQVVEEHPKDEDALSALGNLQSGRKQYADAVETYTKAIAESSKPEKANWPLYYFRGIAYERQKKWPQAEADFKQALSLFPDQPLILNYLGYSWVDQGMNLDEAFNMLHRAVELRPTDGYTVDSLGWADYKLGRYDEAVKELERAIDLKAADPVINDHLGDAYWHVGRKLEAHFQWNHARDLIQYNKDLDPNTETEDLPKILEKIDHGLSDDNKPTTVNSDTGKNGG